MERLGRPGPKPPQLGELVKDVSRELDARSADVRRLEGAGSARLESSDLAGVWRNAEAKGWEPRDATLATLLDHVDPVRARELRTARAELGKLAEVVHSFQALAESLDHAARWPEEEPIDPARARWQYEARKKLQDRLSWVEGALAAAGPCAATARFPKKQLERLKLEAARDVGVLERERDSVKRAPTPQLPAAALATLEGTARSLADLLGRPELVQEIDAAVQRTVGPARAELHANLAAFARLADESLQAPDYARLGKGWFHPRSRSAYRARTHDAWTRFGSEPRQDRSAAATLEVLRVALDAERPDQALGSALVTRFLEEIGARDLRAPKATPAAIRAALEHEVLLPLRALNETVDGMLKGDPGLRGPVQAAVDRITQHVVEGDLREWRYECPAGQRQLEGLGDRAATWRAPLETRHEHPAAEGPGGGRLELTAREEDGLDLLWLTKIGGPSHGFDYGGECLLPLLSNGRTKAIVVDDPRWPHNAAARAYLRLIHFDNGVPALYLEPLQRDFPHRDRFAQEGEDGAFQRAILRHAIAKSDALGVPLSLPPWLGGLLQELGIPVEHHHHHRYLLKASNGVFEASDTLSTKHDWPQMQDELTEGLERFLYVPRRA